MEAAAGVGSAVSSALEGAGVGGPALPVAPGAVLLTACGAPVGEAAPMPGSEERVAPEPAGAPHAATTTRPTSDKAVPK